MPGWSSPGFHRPGRHGLGQARCVRCWADEGRGGVYTLVRAGVKVSAPVNTALFTYFFFRIQKNCCRKSRKHPQQEAVKRLEFEMQRLELEQQLEDMRERMAREKKTRQQNVAHEQWVTEQKRNLQAIKIEKVGETRYPSFTGRTVFFSVAGALTTHRRSCAFAFVAGLAHHSSIAKCTKWSCVLRRNPTTSLRVRKKKS